MTTNLKWAAIAAAVAFSSITVYVATASPSKTPPPSEQAQAVCEAIYQRAAREAKPAIDHDTWLENCEQSFDKAGDQQEGESL